MNHFLIFVLAFGLMNFSACTQKKSGAPTNGSATTAADGVISGKLELAPLLARQPFSKDAVIYLMARSSGETMGPPIAVKRFEQPFHFPIAFSLSKSDSMLPDVPFQGAMTLTARIAQSGSATPAEKGDLEGEVATGPVTVGENKVSLVISKVRP
jgi:hypothetical protein